MYYKEKTHQLIVLLIDSIIYEDQDILVCRKEAGISTQTNQLGQKDMVSIIKNYRVEKKEEPKAEVKAEVKAEPVKKPAAKKTPAKKAPAKKVAAKKETAAKKPAAKKTASKASASTKKSKDSSK